MNITHILQHILDGVIFTLMLVEVDATESENWNFLKYGIYIELENTLCNPYIQGTTVPSDIQ